MTPADIATQRLSNQHLLRGVDNPLKVVETLGAVQAQDFPGAKWAIGQRCKAATDAGITQLYDDGKLLRTHMLRPTWHFVLPQDIRWMLALTSPRVQAFAKNYYKKIDLNEATLARSAQVVAKELAGTQLTRKQVKEVYECAGIDTSGLRLGFLIMYAELEAVICSGAMQGKQHTYALLNERAPETEELAREEALVRLVKRFFAGRSPATARDFGWWASLTMADVRKGVELAGLQSVTVENKTYYFNKLAKPVVSSPIIHLLPNFDEFTVAYKDREPIMQAKLRRTPSSEDLSYHIVVCDSQVVGGWKWRREKDMMKVELNLSTTLNLKQKRALDIAVSELHAFMEMPVEVM